MALQNQLKGGDLRLDGSPQGGVPWQLNAQRVGYVWVHGGACMPEDIHMANNR